jgi:hypothetical protein
MVLDGVSTHFRIPLTLLYRPDLPFFPNITNFPYQSPGIKLC